MTQSDSAFLNWEISDFANLPPFRQSSHKFACKQNTFWMTFFAKDNLPSLKNHFAIYLYREEPLATDRKVLWTIWLINHQGEECYRKVIETIYAADSGHYPIEGGLYHLDRYTILEPSNGLLPDGKLTVKFNVTILDCKNIDDDKQIRLAQKKKKSIQNSESLLDTFSDVFVVDKKEFKLHKNILASKSTVFSAMFENDLEEANQNRVEITDVDVKVFEAMIRFIYTGNVLDSDINQNLFFAAEKYQLDSLKDICVDVLGLNLTTELQNASTSSSSSSSSNRKRKPQTDGPESKNTKKITKTRKSSGQNAKKMLACKFPDCDRSFPSDWKLANHERIHLSIKPFSCTWSDCKYSSKQRIDVVQHIRLVHFKLPRSVKEQKELNIIDDRDPNEFVRVDQQLANRRL